MADLHAIDAQPVAAGVIEYLEHVLERAQDGRISAIAIAYVYRDGSTGSGWSNQHSLGAMVGSVAALQAKLIGEMIDDE